MTIVSEIVQRGKNIESLKNERLRRRSVRHSLIILRKNMLLPERDIPYFNTEKRDIEKACGTIERAMQLGTEEIRRKYAKFSHA